MQMEAVLLKLTVSILTTHFKNETLHIPSGGFRRL